MKELDRFDELEPMTGAMRAAVRHSIETADHLKDSDEADVQLAYQLADIIDAARDSGDQEAITRRHSARCRRCTRC